MTKLEEVVARKIADEVGQGYDAAYENKREWTADRGKRADINAPFKGDYRDAARAAIALVVEEAVKAIDLQAEPILEALQRAKDAGDRELGRIYSDAAAVLLRARRAVRALAAETKEG